ncbi:MAG: TRIC cation channel family protein, partial [Prevotella sp.]|nr:TRIC cation channel family protein [Prevotella sp.]
QSSPVCDLTYCVGILIGCRPGSAGGVIRDVLLNNEPVIFQREIYAMASVLGGITYWALDYMGVPVEVTVMVSFLLMCLIRFLAVRYHLSLPRLKSEQADMDE